MVLRLRRNRLGSGVALPWETVDPHEGEAPSAFEAESAQWFLDSPPGEWNIESPPDVQEIQGGQPAEEELNVPAMELDIEDQEEEVDTFPTKLDGGGWTVAILCVGLSLIAACVIIPQADANHRLAYQQEKLRLDLAQIQKQVAVNREFLSKIESDPQLTERLAQREMRSVPAGQTALDLKSDADSAQTASAAAARMSPFSIVKVPPPPPLMPYKPVGGEFAELCRESQSHGYILGTGMILVAAGLVLSGSASGES
jgi:hypothetical protein